MTKLLEKAFNEASKLTELEQNRLAKWLIEEVISEKKWENDFSKSKEILGELADEALQEFNNKDFNNIVRNNPLTKSLI
jgi:hypothetical protein